MAIGPILGALGLGASILGQSRAQRQARDMQQQAIAGAGTRPEIASYEAVELNPVDFQEVQRQTLQGNIDVMGLIEQLMQGNAGINQRTSQNRSNAFSPAMWGNVGRTADVASDYLAGKPSWSDSMETVARSTGLTGAVGTPGTGAALTARDLGLFDMDLRQRGAQMNAQAIQQGEALDPRGNYGTPHDWQLTPRETVPWKVNENLQLSEMAIKQAENQYVSDQSGFNIAAGPDPRAVAGLAFGQQANQGVNWGQVIGGLGSIYGSMQMDGAMRGGLNTGGTYNTARAAQSAAPYAAGASGNMWGGYTPKARLA